MENQLQPISLEVISPEQTLLSCNVISVELPGTLGPFVVLRDHAPVVSSLESGLIRYTTGDGSREELRIRSGFVSVSNNSVTACVEL
ncbi:MAG: F0F1 ATP synthase subunit epsilon [Candidatus Cryptobacteroides sp.]